MLSVLARCEELRVETGGWFDARAGGRLDPSGYVKGWAVERAAAFGRGRCLIDAGGDVVLRGTWRVGVRHPYERDRLAAAITVSDCAVATSGAYERGPHILDPHTGRPASGLASVTVIDRDLGTADAYATAAFAAGDPAWTAPLAAMSSPASACSRRRPGLEAEIARLDGPAVVPVRQHPWWDGDVDLDLLPRLGLATAKPASQRAGSARVGPGRRYYTWTTSRPARRRCCARSPKHARPWAAKWSIPTSCNRGRVQRRSVA